MARAARIKAAAQKEIETRFAEAFVRFKKEVGRRMDRRGMSGAELARRMGISRAAVSRILAPGSNPTLRTMVELAWALDAELEVAFHRPRPRLRNTPRLKLELHSAKRSRG